MTDSRAQDQPRSSNRDLRVDLIRGVALLVLMTDHLPGNSLARITPAAFGLADMADVFLLLSGYVFGLGLMRQRSPSIRWRRAFTRIAAIYVGYCVTALLMVWLVKTFRIGSVAQTLPPALIANSWTTVLPEITLLGDRISHLSILLLYLWLAMTVMLLPVSVWKRWKTTIAFSISIYTVTQLLRVPALPGALQNATFYNPFAWQFLFVSGVYLACWPWLLNLGGEHQRRLGMLCLIVIAAVLVAHIVAPASWYGIRNKSSLGILRYLHVMGMAIVVATIFPKEFSSNVRRLTRPVCLCSEQSLWVYCAGTLIVVGLSDFSYEQSSLLLDPVINVAAWTGCVLVAAIVSKLKSRFRVGPGVTSKASSGSHESTR